MSSRHEDDRGVIQDILGPVDAVTTIYTVKGAIRGNHVHKLTTQWTWIATGRLLVVTDHDGTRSESIYGPGEMACETPGIPHAWKALEDTVAVVFTRGPRSGEDYESDTYRDGIALL